MGAIRLDNKLIASQRRPPRPHSACLPVYLSVHPPARPPDRRSVSLAICLFVCLLAYCE